MKISAQNRAIRSYRSRMRKLGIARFEVLGLESDRELIRSLAKRLTRNDPEAAHIRHEVSRKIADEPSKKGGILAALRRSPLVGIELEINRSKETGRKVDL